LSTSLSWSLPTPPSSSSSSTSCNSSAQQVEFTRGNKGDENERVPLPKAEVIRGGRTSACIERRSLLGISVKHIRNPWAKR
jgi:hypothetical protein